MPPKLRYEIYLPTSYNDKSPIEPKKYRLVKNKLQNEFGGLSVHPFTIQGIWINPKDKKRFYDNCARYEIVVEKSPENEEFTKKRSERIGRDLQSFKFKTYEEAFKFYSNLGFNINRYKYGDLVSRLHSLDALYGDSDEGKKVQEIQNMREIWLMSLK